MKIKAVSLFASAGIGELHLPNNIEVIVANELLKQRAECYKFFYPKTNMICGDINSNQIKNKIISLANENQCSLLIATPPCQGLSTLGKNKKQSQYELDKRNFLIFNVFDIIDSCNFDYILIENVPKFLDMYFPYESSFKHLDKILLSKYGSKYIIEARILNAKDYGVPQSRPRAIIKMYKKGLKWGWPNTEDEISLKKAIGYLPSLNPGEDSGIPWHYAKKQNNRIITAMRHTEPGKSALTNEIYYPKKADGSRIKGFHNTYKRMVWDQPCPARTTYSGSISSHNNVHPGYLQPDGTYSDPRVLTLLETFIVSSIPENIVFPPNSTETFIRTVIGEAIPPRLMEKIIAMIGDDNNAYNG
ncbi:DNA cytosine methyltransferase [Catenibacterium mitsuokai]|uniref:DNA cytosine methyltransferase n=1 Tax=Catenibacterium mitsuokai TaxID=100886 RepID=UPI003F8EDD8A